MREGGTEDGVWVGERWICSVGVLRVEKVVFGGVWKKQQCGDNMAALGYLDHLYSVEMDFRECLRGRAVGSGAFGRFSNMGYAGRFFARQTKAPRRKNGEGLMVLVVFLGLV